MGTVGREAAAGPKDVSGDARGTALNVRPGVRSGGLGVKIVAAAAELLD